MTEGGGSKRIAFVTLGYGSYSPTFLLCTSVKGSEFLACTCIIGSGCNTNKPEYRSINWRYGGGGGGGGRSPTYPAGDH